MEHFRSSPLRRIATYILIATTATAATSGGVFAQSDSAGLYLYQIPSGRTVGEIPANDESLYLDLYVSDPASSIESLTPSSSIDVVIAAEDFVRIRLSKSANLIGNAAIAHTEPTFVVDYDRAPIENLSRQLRSEYGPSPGIAEIVDFVDQQIPVKSYRHGFAVASQVARISEGDCTEHAVLLTALARAQGWPARLVFGVLVLVDGDDVQSFGHAWSEAYDGQRWHISDATRPDRAKSKAHLYYLPLFTMRDEGPGYAFELMQLITLQPSRISLVSAIGPDDSDPMD